MQVLIQSLADTQTAQINIMAKAMSDSAPDKTTSSSSIGLVSVAASTVRILDVSKTSPPNHCWILHENNVIHVKLKHIHWDDGQPTYEVTPIERYKGYVSIEVDGDNIWPYDDNN